MEDNIERLHIVKPFTEEERLRGIKCANAAYEWIRVGPKGYVFTSFWLEYAEEIRQMPLRSTDTWVVTFPRSGTTWTQELVWLVNNNLNFEKAKAIPLIKRYEFLDLFEMYGPVAKDLLKDCKDEKTRNALKEMLSLAHRALADTPSPRFIKTHLPLSLLPANTLDTCKVVYVARDPRDVVISCYHLLKNMKMLHCEFKEFFDTFLDDMSFRTPYFEHVKEAWMQRNHPNVLFLFYEELSDDLKNTAKKVADFSGKTYTEKQYDQLCEHLEFKNFQSNKSVSYKKNVVDAGFIASQDFSKIYVRKGKAGGWRDDFDAEMTARAQSWMKRNLQDTDLRFPLQEF